MVNKILMSANLILLRRWCNNLELSAVLDSGKTQGKLVDCQKTPQNWLRAEELIPRLWATYFWIEARVKYHVILAKKKCLWHLMISPYLEWTVPTRDKFQSSLAITDKNLLFKQSHHSFFQSKSIMDCFFLNVYPE